MKQNQKTASAEYWEKSLNFEPTNAYKATSRKPMYPKSDFIDLSFKQAEVLKEIGSRVAIIHPSESALPAFSVDIGFAPDDNSFLQLYELLQPKLNPSRDYEMSIYAISLLFSASSDHVACDITAHFGCHSGGGCEYIGTIGFKPRNDLFFTFPYYMDADSYEQFGLYDLEALPEISEWLGYLWNGIQHQFINRPEKISFYHHRNHHHQDDNSIRKGSNYRSAKVIRNINICIDDNISLELKVNSGYHISLSIWSVAGHWRTTRSGKKVWIAPYYKGKDRNKNSATFSAKKYQFDKEVFD